MRMSRGKFYAILIGLALVAIVAVSAGRHQAHKLIPPALTPVATNGVVRH